MAEKNEKERIGMRNAYIHDAITLSNFSAYLEIEVSFVLLTQDKRTLNVRRQLWEFSHNENSKAKHYCFSVNSEKFSFSRKKLCSLVLDRINESSNLLFKK